VQAPTKVRVGHQSQARKALGRTILPGMLAIADEVIE
jgi:hypothetical protein